jgi:hypothetical protein
VVGKVDPNPAFALPSPAAPRAFRPPALFFFLRNPDCCVYIAGVKREMHYALHPKVHAAIEDTIVLDILPNNRNPAQRYSRRCEIPVFQVEPNENTPIFRIVDRTAGQCHQDAPSLG